MQMAVQLGIDLFLLLPLRWHYSQCGPLPTYWTSPSYFRSLTSFPICNFAFINTRLLT